MVMPTLTNTLDVIGKIIETASAAKTIMDKIDNNNSNNSSKNTTTEVVKQAPIVHAHPVEIVPSTIEQKQPTHPVVVNINVYINDNKSDPFNGRKVLIETANPR